MVGGLALVRASGGTILTDAGRGWETFDAFASARHDENAMADLRHWRRHLVIGREDAVYLLASRA